MYLKSIQKLIANSLLLRQELVVLTIFIGTHGYCQSTKVYSNPVIQGDWSDPGVVRVGEDYYTVRSTFGWMPGLHIAHSKDLVHWEYLGFADVANASNMPSGITDAGVWGSDIGYNPHTKTFLVYAPVRDDIQVFYAKDPAGPYTDGGVVTKGYDPGFFVDDDGSMYLTKTGGNIYKLTSDGLRIDGPPIAEVSGGEGPEIFKRNGYYYYLISPGGTRPYQHHKIMSYRAKYLSGPWEEDPNNPVMYAPHTTNAKLQGPGHGEVFQTQNGEWYLTYHAYELSHYSLGRQTCLEPVIWSEDGWWKPKNKKVPSEQNAFPSLQPVKHELQDSDDFNAPILGKQWFFHTKPDYSGKSWSLNENPGYLRIKTQQGDIGSQNVRKGLFLQRVIRKKFDITSTVTFDATENGEAAGIHLYHDPNRSIWLTSTYADGKKVIEIGYYDKLFPSHLNPGTLKDPEIHKILSTIPATKKIVKHIENNYGNTVHLKMSIDGNETVSFAVSGNGKTWKTLGSSIYFGDSWHYVRQGKARGVPDLGWVGVGRQNVWTGTVMGVFACGGSSTLSKNADFQKFTVINKDLP
ncbi:family 43 glycosylhydrolase [Flagellimonas sp. HMM57]|uniref:family 43 glycosylhydrolase n=1 Tax=unclassified Flagellimonas TaxID=2644544 RepID=UPI0013D39879|nr:MULTISPECIES: family 43 glycosylhydrolase [unclassified Flagellimonas]UII77665.1 family 43 glycosylhydrolase [Flagellimonas sp. HMM57]